MWFERWILSLPVRLRSVLSRERVDADLRDELRYHIERRTEEGMARGLRPAEARREALLAFGGIDRITEACRDVRRPGLRDTLAQDLRYSVRLLRRDRSYAAVVVGTLGLAIGATSAVLSVVDGVLLRPVPFESMDRLVMIWGTDRSSGTVREPISVPDYLDFEAAAQGLIQAAAFRGLDMNLAVPGGEPMRVAAMAVTADFLHVVGVRPLVGRGFVAGEDRRGGAATVLIGETFWERHFDRAPDVVGKMLLLNERPFTIQGVLPRDADFGALQVLSAADYARGFADRGDATRVEVWTPFVLDTEAMPRYLHPLFTVARLHRGVHVAGLQAALTPVARELEQQYAVNEYRGINVEALSDVVFKPVRTTLLLLLGAVALVLLIACANVANLILARGTTRAREVAVRGALGATATRLAKQFMVENAVLALAAAAVGVLLALTGLELFLGMAPASVPRIDSVVLDLRVLAIVLGLALTIAIVFGTIPVVQARRSGLYGVLRREAGASASREMRRVRSALVVAEIGLSIVLLIGAGLLLRSYWNAVATDPGFRVDGVLKAEFQLPASRYPVDEWPRLAEIHDFNDRVLTRAAALPGVESAALTRNHPLDAGSRNSFTIIGREEESRRLPEISIRSVSSAYFSTLGIRLLAGHGIAPTDRAETAPIMVINETAAHRLFPGGDAIGQRIAVWGAQREIVGIVSDERIHGVTEQAPPAVYMPLAQVPPRDGNESLLLRFDGEPTELSSAVRALFREVDPAIALFGVEPLSTTLARSIVQRRLTAGLLAIFAGGAVVLTLVGIHSLMMYAVLQRRREFGVRMALGAQRHTILLDVLSEGLRLSFWGLSVGLMLAAGLMSLLSSLLYEVSMADPATIIAAVAALSILTLFICALAAWYAARTDPCGVLRDA